jgi:hypothetical protein
MKFGISNLAPISEVVEYWLSWEGMECSCVMSEVDFAGYYWYSCCCRAIFFWPIVTGSTEIIIIATFAATGGKEIAAVLLAKA